MVARSETERSRPSGNAAARYFADPLHALRSGNAIQTANRETVRRGRGLGSQKLRHRRLGSIRTLRLLTHKRTKLATLDSSEKHRGNIRTAKIRIELAGIIFTANKDFDRIHFFCHGVKFIARHSKASLDIFTAKRTVTGEKVLDHLHHRDPAESRNLLTYRSRSRQLDRRHPLPRGTEQKSPETPSENESKRAQGFRHREIGPFCHRHEERGGRVYVEQGSSQNERQDHPARSPRQRTPRATLQRVQTFIPEDTGNGPAGFSGDSGRGCICIFHIGER